MKTTDILSFIKRNEDDDVAYIVAAAINIHGEAMRRLSGRTKYEVYDVKNLMTLIEVLVGERMVQPKRPPSVDEAKFEAEIAEQR